jgi:hypothetical protein
MSALQDPASVQAGNTTEILRKQIASHKNPVLCLRWLPASIEIDRKVFYNLLPNTCIKDDLYDSQRMSPICYHQPGRIGVDLGYQIPRKGSKEAALGGIL